MPFQYLIKIIFKKEATLKEVLERFNETAIHTENSGFGIITDKNNKCIGVVTDGDIRKKLIDGIGLDTQIGKIYNKEFIYSRIGDSPHKILRLFDKRIKSIPVVDEDAKCVDLIQLSNFKVDARHEHKIIRARVPVRVSFSGGGTDMTYYFNSHQSTVLSSTINKYAYATVLIRRDDKVNIISKDLNLEYKTDSFDTIQYGDKLDLVKASVKIMQPKFGFDLETYAEFEPGTGLGGSSAISVAVIGAFNHFRNENQLDKYHIADLAYQAERIELGIKGGWQDQYATTFGGINWIEFRQNEIMVYPLKVQKDILLELQYNLLLFRFGQNRFSGDIAQHQSEHYAENKSFVESKYTLMTELAFEMKEALLRGYLKRFGDLLDQGWQLKKEFYNKISNSYIDKLYATAKKEGALGGKVLGAGGNGYLLIYASPLYQRAIVESLESQKAKPVHFNFVDEGLETWVTKK